MVYINVFETKQEMGNAAAEKAAEIIRNAIDTKGTAYFVAATGTSQFEFLNALIMRPEIEWKKTEMFHLDEYIGLSADHLASFRKFLSERIVNKVEPRVVHFIKGDAPNIDQESKRISNLISRIIIDVAFVGLGENGHLAFNDPPADFETKNPYIVVNLDKTCRMQQVGEGWFKSLNEVPKKAISMSIQEIMRATNIICTCPDERKAQAVKNCIATDAIITPMHPGSILKSHHNVFCYLDKFSAKLL